MCVTVMWREEWERKSGGKESILDNGDIVAVFLG